LTKNEIKQIKEIESQLYSLEERIISNVHTTENLELGRLTFFMGELFKEMGDLRMKLINLLGDNYP
jgi:hypothetical protein